MEHNGTPTWTIKLYPNQSDLQLEDIKTLIAFADLSHLHTESTGERRFRGLLRSVSGVLGKSILPTCFAEMKTLALRAQNLDGSISVDLEHAGAESLPFLGIHDNFQGSILVQIDEIGKGVCARKGHFRVL